MAHLIYIDLQLELNRYHFPVLRPLFSDHSSVIGAISNMTTQGTDLGRRQSLASVARSKELDSISHMLESVCLDRTSKDICRVRPVHIPNISLGEFTKNRKYLQGKEGLQIGHSSQKQHAKEIKDLLRFSPSKHGQSHSQVYLSREKLGTADVKQALRHFRRQFGEGSLLQSTRPWKPQPALVLGRPLFEEKVSRKEQLDKFIGKYMEKRRRYKGPLDSISAHPSPHFSPLGSPSHSPSCHTDPKQLKRKLQLLPKEPQLSEELDFDSDANLIHEIQECSSALLRDQSRIKNFTQAKFRQMRVAGRHLAL